MQLSLKRKSDPMDINLELYKVFYYVATTLSFSEASRELFISQSAVSQSIKTLEKKLNHTLFIRSTKKVLLTPEGELLLQHVKPAIQMLDEGESLLSGDNMLKGQLRIGASDTICRYYLIHYLQKFHQEFPDVRIKVTNSTSIGCAELLEKGQRLGIDFTASAYQVFLFKLMQEGDSTGCSEKLNRASEKVNDLAGSWERVLSFDRSPEGWAFLIKGESEGEVQSTYLETRKELLELVEGYPKIEYFGGIGNVVHRIGDIQTSYKEAARAEDVPKRLRRWLQNTKLWQN